MMLKKYIKLNILALMLVCNVLINFGNASDVRLNGFLLNWDSDGTHILNNSLYKRLDYYYIAFAFLNAKGNLVWQKGWDGNPDVLLSADVIKIYLKEATEVPTNKFLLSFGGAANMKWSALKSNPKDIAKKLADIINQVQLGGIDIDYEDLGTATDADFRKSFAEFVTTLRENMPKNKIITIDVPNTGGCAAKSELQMCQYFSDKSDYIGKFTWLANEDILKNIDYYNVMGYTWMMSDETSDQYAQWTQDAVTSYYELKVPYEKLLLGIDNNLENNSPDFKYITPDNIKKFVSYATKNSLAGIFIWDLNNDYKSQKPGNPWGENSIINAIEGVQNKEGLLRKTTNSL